MGGGRGGNRRGREGKGREGEGKGRGRDGQRGGRGREGEGEGREGKGREGKGREGGKCTCLRERQEVLLRRVHLRVEEELRAKEPLVSDVKGDVLGVPQWRSPSAGIGSVPKLSE